MKKRIVNIRPAFVAFVALVLGILFYCFMFLTKSKTTLNVIVGFIFAALLIVLILLVVTGFVYKASSVNVLKIICKHRFHFIIFALLVVIGFSSLMLTTIYKNNTLKTFEGEYLIVGSIKDDYYEKGMTTFVTLDNVAISNQTETHSLKSKLKVVIFTSGLIDSDHVYAGNIMQFRAVIEKTPFVADGINMSAYVNNTVYSTTINSGYSFSSGKMSADEYIRHAYLTRLHENMSPEMANLSFSLLFGNDKVLTDDIMDLFSVSGVVHIISVSGLHVAVFVLVIVAVLKLFRVKHGYQIVIVGIALVFYSYLCGFVPTVLRSAIMSLVFLSARSLGERYDTLTSLSLSGILLLMFTPHHLFDLGFQLSFVSMYGLFTFCPLINDWCKRIKIPGSLYMPISMTISATIVTMPLILVFFYRVSTYSVISNLIAVPVMSLAYILLFLICSVGIFVPFVLNALIVPNIMLHFSKIALRIIYDLPFNTIRLFSDGYITLIILLTIGFVLKYVMAGKKAKTIMVSAFVFVMSVIVLVSNMPKTYYVNAFHLSYQKATSVTLVTSENGKSVLVGSYFGSENEKNVFDKTYKIKKIDIIVINDFSYKTFESSLKTIADYDIKIVVIAGHNGSDKQYVQENATNCEVYFVEDSISVYDFEIKIYSENQKVLATEITLNSKSILVVRNNILLSDMRALNNYINTAEYVAIVYNGQFRWLEELDATADIVVIFKSDYADDHFVNLKEQTTFTLKF